MVVALAPVERDTADRGPAPGEEKAPRQVSGLDLGGRDGAIGKDATLAQVGLQLLSRALAQTR